MRVSAADLLAANNLLPAETPEKEIGKWFGWLICAFLFGAAAGGYTFGYAGDKVGRSKAMAASIFCYSIFSCLTYFAATPTQLLVLRFLTCMGIGGMWPNAIALVSEAWPNISRPFLSGVIGTSANVGILLFALLTTVKIVTLDDWRWTLLVGASPIVLAVFVLFKVPESPRWLALQRREGDANPKASDVRLGEIFSPAIRRTTMLGVLLATIPLFGGWGVGNWANAWASEIGDRVQTEKVADGNLSELAEQIRPKNADPRLKSWAVIARSLPGSISSLLGGALAFWLGRRRSYFLLCLCALICTQFLFRTTVPGTREFLFWTGALGFFSGFFFGWLPLCLPELFPTRVRSTGAGVSFNWGRILTGLGVLATAAMLKESLSGKYDVVGQYTGFIYALGMVFIVLTPNTSGKKLED
jgi:SHS family sialic acid transporter-like MFS transporter